MFTGKSAGSRVYVLLSVLIVLLLLFTSAPPILPIASAEDAVEPVEVINEAPVAGDDAYSLEKGGTLEISAPGLLANDTDAEGEALTALILTDPAYGTLTLNADGSFTYIHDGSETTSDSFTYKASDGTSESNVATVILTIVPPNTPPVVSDDAYALDEGGTLEVPTPGVLANDTDTEGEVLTALILTGPAHGTLTLNADGSFTYTHDGSETTSDSFTYKVSDGKSDLNSAAVTLTINAVNDPPVAVDDSYGLEGCKAFEVPAPGVLANDTDAEGEALTATKLTDPSHGTLSLNPDGSFTYTCQTIADLPGPASGTGSFAADTETQSEPVIDSFTYSASDGKSDSNIATVTITIEPGKPAEGKSEIVIDHNLKKVTATVTPDRDTEIDSYGGKMKLGIPQGALDQETEIEITDHGQWGPRAGGILNVFEFNAFAEVKVSGEPAEGEDAATVETITRTPVNEFKKGLVITIQHTPEELAGFDIRSLKLCYLDEKAEQWVPVPSTYDLDTGILTATIDHFSFWSTQANPAILLAGPDIGSAGRTAVRRSNVHIPHRGTARCWRFPTINRAYV